MKKVIPLLAVVAVVCVAALIARQESSRRHSPATEDAPITGSGTDKPVSTDTSVPADASRGSLSSTAGSASVPAAGDAPKVVPVDSLLTKLAGQNVLVLDFVPRNLDAVFAPVVAFYTRLTQTKLWQKLKPDAMLAAGAEQAAAGGNPGLQALAMMGGGIPPEAKELWNALSEISIAVSTKTVPVDSGGRHFDVPAVALIAKFSSDENAKKYSQMLNALVQPLKEQAQMVGFEITEPTPGTIDASGPIPNTNAKLVASLSTKSQHMLLLIGSKDPLDFFEKKGPAPSAAAELASRAWVQNTAFAMSLQFDSLMKMLEPLMTTMVAPGDTSAQQIEQMKKAFAMYNGIKMATLAIGMDSGIVRNNSCSTIEPGAPMGKIYSAVLKGNALQMRSTSLNLIDEQTIFTLDYPIWMLQQTWSSFQEMSPTNLTEDQKKGLAALEKFNGFVDRFNFQKAAFVISTAPSGPMPRFALLLTDSKLAGEDLLQQFTDSLNELVAFAQTSQGGGTPASQVAKLVKTGTTPQVQIQTGMMQLIGQVAGNNSLVLGLDPYFMSNISDRLSGKTTGKLAVASAAAKGDVDVANQVMYMNLGLGFDLVRPWLGTMIPAGQNISAEEVGEILDLLKTSIVASTRFERMSDSTFCSYSATFQN